MKKTLVLLMLMFLLAFGTAIAGELTSHPSGFGKGSYAAWKAKEGLPDTSGNANQALYLQKMVPTATFAAGIVVVTDPKEHLFPASAHYPGSIGTTVTAALVRLVGI